MRHRKLATINSTKHIINNVFTTVAAGVLASNVEADSVAVPDVANANDVRAGSVIKAIFVELWVLAASSANPASIQINVEKTKGGQPTMTVAQSNALNDYPNKANILYTTQGIIGDDTNNAVPFIRQWIAIPKGKQRFALGDQLRVNIVALTVGLSNCGVSIYKEYY